MSTKSYSIDLRERVIQSVESGVSQTQTARIYKIGLNTVNRWWHRYKKEVLCTAKPRGGSRGKVNPQELRLYVERNCDKTLIQIGKIFKVSGCSIYRRLKKLGFSYKKKPFPIWKQAKKKERNTGKL
jgi:transposase